MTLTKMTAEDLRIGVEFNSFYTVLFNTMSRGWRIEMPEPGFFVGPLNMNLLLRGVLVEEWPGIYTHPDHGELPFFVDDSPEAVIERLKPVLQEAEGIYAVTITEVRKADEPIRGGWRWHKWGPYLGKHEPQCEYLYDEPEIDSIVTAHIYEVSL